MVHPAPATPVHTSGEGGRENEDEQAQRASSLQMVQPAPGDGNFKFPAGSVFGPAWFSGENGESDGLDLNSPRRGPHRNRSRTLVRSPRRQQQQLQEGGPLRGREGKKESKKQKERSNQEKDPRAFQENSQGKDPMTPERSNQGG